ncbi:MAG TPA: ATP-binding protein [Planctomycetota bacterium]|nr:ATP-binding protein [Planctomycetota bacterium]
MIAGTLRGRVFSAVAGVLVVVLAGAELYGEGRIRAFHRSELERRLDAAFALLADRARAALAGGGAREGFRSSVRSLGETSGLRLTLIDDDGTVLADSEADLPLANHGDRAEVVQARKTGRGTAQRRSATTRQDTLYVARRIEEGGRTLGFLRAAAELDRVEAEIASLRRTLLLGGGVALALGLAASWEIARRLSRPLEAMERSAAAIAGGSLEGRVRAAGPREVRRLGESLNRMAEELRARIDAAQRARLELEAVLAGMSEGVVAVDAGERVLLMNGAAGGLLGLGAPLPSGTPLWEALRFPELETAVRRVLAGGRGWSGDAPAPGGRGRILELSVAPVAPDGGAVSLLRDVTEVRRLEAMRRDFVANVSHELRTPLSAVRGALETLADPGEDARTRAQFLEMAQRNAERLGALVSDLLDLSAIEAEGDRISLEPVAVDRALRAAAATLAESARAKGVSLEVEAGPERPLTVLGNARRLEQAFANLLENAIKYTPARGSVTARGRNREREVAVEIEDTGIGIPAASLPRIFERFYRVDAGRSRETGGTGLGLAIVKHIVQAHRGRVEVRSEEGKGSTFSVFLPKGSAGEPPPRSDGPEPLLHEIPIPP